LRAEPEPSSSLSWGGLCGGSGGGINVTWFSLAARHMTRSTGGDKTHLKDDGTETEGEEEKKRERDTANVRFSQTLRNAVSPLLQHRNAVDSFPLETLSVFLLLSLFSHSCELPVVLGTMLSELPVFQ